MSALGLKLLMGGKWLLQLLVAGIEWLARNPERLIAAVFAAGFVWQAFVAVPHLRADRDAWHSAADEWKTAAGAWQAAHGKLLANVLQAQKDAAAADRANVARVEREYQAINERTSDAYQARAADTRAALGRVRAQYAAIADGDQGDLDRANLSEALGARCRALGAADCNALLAALPDRLAAAEDNTSKLIELQDYVRSSLLIDFSGDGR